MNRVAIIKNVAEYMASKGKFLSMSEYSRQKDVPCNAMNLRKAFGSWSRIQLLVRCNHPTLWNSMLKGIPTTTVEPVVEKKTTKPAKKKTAVKKDAK
jgi:hypothetical protein